MAIGDKLNDLLLANNMKPGTLARETNISKSTIYGIIKRNNKKVDLSILETIAAHLGVSIDYFFDSEGEASPTLSERELQMIGQFRTLDRRGQQAIEALMKVELQHAKKSPSPPQSRLMLPVYVFPAAAGDPLFADNDFDHVDFPANQVPKGADFGIRIRGDSMEPTVADGVVVFVKRVEELNTGDIGVFMIDDEAACKRFSMDNGSVSLLSDNPDYGTIQVSDYQRFAIVGKVLGYK